MNKFLAVGIFICGLFFFGGDVYGEAPIKGEIQIPPEVARAATIFEIKPFLESPDGRIRIAAVRRLAQIGDKNAVKILAEAFDKESSSNFPYVKEEILEALGKIGGKEAKGILLSTLTINLKKGPKGVLDDDYFYFNEVRAASRAIYNIYSPKEDIEIYEFFKPIALGETEDKFIMQNGDLRILAYKLYYKTEVFNKGFSKEDAIKYIKESIKPYTKDEGYGYESPGILSQKTVERGAKKQLLKEYGENK